MKKLPGKVFLLWIVTFFFIQPAIAQNNATDKQQDVEQIRLALQHWPKLVVGGEKDKLLHYFTDDAIIMGPRQPTIKGKDAIWQMMERNKSIPGYKLEWDPEPSSITVSKGGDLAYMTINNRVTMNDATGTPKTQKNKAVLIWRKEPDNSWKEALIIFNEDLGQ